MIVHEVHVRRGCGECADHARLRRIAAPWWSSECRWISQQSLLPGRIVVEPELAHARPCAWGRRFRSLVTHEAPETRKLCELWRVNRSEPLLAPVDRDLGRI